MTDKKIRVYELAKELNLSNTEMINMLQKYGVEIKSHMSSVEQSVIDAVKASKNAPEVVLEKSEKVEEKQVIAPVINNVSSKVESAGDDEILMKLPIVVKDLASALKIKPNDLIVELMKHKVMASINQTVSQEVAEEIALKYDKILVIDKREKSNGFKKAELEIPEEVKHKGNAKDMSTRPPVVAFMGHVDHGKTSLQDALRKTNVTLGEAGGITQHIGSSVLNYQGQLVTMLDTPGHAAFSSMRARGANVTDIAILVVAANDGVMPQTIEAIRHAKAAGVPIIVAMNKMDLEDINPDRVYMQLSQHEVMVEDWGGDVGCRKVSAMTGMGLDDLMERILLEAEMLELTANPKIPGRAVVVEARMEAGTGVHTNILVQDGTIKVGD
ncbi:MAG: translation initiation factor IF-2, partial [Lentisphaeria bacterium]